MLGPIRRLPTERKLKFEGRAAIVAAGIAFMGVLIGTILGQRMSATMESDKTVRVKLEEAYFRTVAVSRLAEDLNMAALSTLTSSNYLAYAGQYNIASERYREEIFKIVAISDLYETTLSSAAKLLDDCGNKFNIAAGDHFLLRARASSEIKVAGSGSLPPITPQEITQSQNSLVKLRLECAEVANQMRKVTATVMKAHM